MQYDRCPHKSRNLGTIMHKKRMPCENKDRYWGDWYTEESQKHQRLPENPRSWDRDMEKSLPDKPQKKLPNHKSTLFLGFWHLELWENTFLLYKPLGLWYFVTAAQANTVMSEFEFLLPHQVGTSRVKANVARRPWKVILTYSSF